MKIFINVLTYQAVWFLAILGGNSGAAVACILLLVHLAMSDCKSADLKMMVLLLFLGFLVDGLLQYLGFFSFRTPGFPIPFWLAVIWLGLAITVHHSLDWLKARILLSFLFGALGGPIAYFAGYRLDAAAFNWPLPSSLLLLAVIWAALFPTIIFLSVVSKR